MKISKLLNKKFLSILLVFSLIFFSSSYAEDEPVNFEELTVEPYSTPHDAEESVAFVIRYQGKSLGIAIIG